ncbi:hypothetical protein ABH920_002421 [Catenulispora sp. EB89]
MASRATGFAGLGSEAALVVAWLGSAVVFAAAA